MPRVTFQAFFVFKSRVTLLSSDTELAGNSESGLIPFTIGCVLFK